jgi:hypothetical protein
MMYVSTNKNNQWPGLKLPSKEKDLELIIGEKTARAGLIYCFCRLSFLLSFFLFIGLNTTSATTHNLSTTQQTPSSTP